MFYAYGLTFGAAPSGEGLWDSHADGGDCCGGGRLPLILFRRMTDSQQSSLARSAVTITTKVRAYAHAKVQFVKIRAYLKK